MTYGDALKRYRPRPTPLPEERILGQLVVNNTRPDGRSCLGEALAVAMAVDVGDYSAAEHPSLDWRHQVAMLGALLDLARQLAEVDVLLLDLKAKIAEAQKIMEVGQESAATPLGATLHGCLQRSTTGAERLTTPATISKGGPLPELDVMQPTPHGWDEEDLF